jgi:hypothetical protein
MTTYEYPEAITNLIDKAELETADDVINLIKSVLIAHVQSAVYKPAIKPVVEMPLDVPFIPVETEDELFRLESYNKIEPLLYILNILELAKKENN